VMQAAPESPSAIYARQGITLDRSALADWVGNAAFTLRPVHTRLLELLKQSTKLTLRRRRRRTRSRAPSRKGNSGPMRVTSGLGPATLRQAFPTFMRPTTSMRGRPSILWDSAIPQVDGYGAYAELA